LPEDRTAGVAGELNMIRRAAARSNRLADRAALLELLAQARETLSIYGGALQRGHIDVAPVKIGSRSPCAYCDYAGVCRVDEAYNPFRSSPLEGIGE
jgi:ATP-dependent helicase/DNAse subunit B